MLILLSLYNFDMFLKIWNLNSKNGLYLLELVPKRFLALVLYIKKLFMISFKKVRNYISFFNVMGRNDVFIQLMEKEKETIVI